MSMDETGPDPAEIFLLEARELLESLEQGLLDLDQAPADSERVNAVFRALHTLKGSGAMFGYARLAAFLHSFEDAFDAVRDQRARATPRLVSVALDAAVMVAKTRTPPSERPHLSRTRLRCSTGR